MTPLHNDEERLAVLFQAYRMAVPDPEGSPEFMPRLWERIEARQRATAFFRHLAAGLATSAAVISLLLFLISIPGPRTSRSVVYRQTYLEVLAEEHAAQSPVYAEPVSVESDSESELLNEML